MAVKLFVLDVPPDQVHRFVAELDVIVQADLQHPCIASPVAAGISGVSAYLAQEFVVAEPPDIIQREGGHPPPAEACWIVERLADALDFAAGREVLHGALHLRDVLVAPDVVRLTGLGVAPALQRCGLPAPVRRPYAAPELLGSRSWDRHADVFGLAAIAHVLLWGRRVTATGEAAADALTELPGCELDALRSAFARALADNPSNRYDTARAFARALEDGLLVAGESETPSDGVALASDRTETSVEAQSLDQFASELQDDEGDLRPTSSSSDYSPTPEELRLFDREAEISVDETEIVTENAGSVLPTPTRQPSPEAPFLHEAEARSVLWPVVLSAVFFAAVGFTAGNVMATLAGVTLLGGAAVQVPPETESSASPILPVNPSSDGNPPEPEPSAAPTEIQEPDVRPPTARPEPVVVPGQLLVKSFPEGALVEVDGRDVGATPLTVGDLSLESHIVAVRQDGYATARHRVSLTAQEPAQSLTVALVEARAPQAEPARRTVPLLLTVDSRPIGAAVIIDGRRVGRTPLTIEQITEGEHLVELEMDGYQRWTSTVQVRAGQGNRVAASLELTRER